MTTLYFVINDKTHAMRSRSTMVVPSVGDTISLLDGYYVIKYRLFYMKNISEKEQQIELGIEKVGVD